MVVLPELTTTEIIVDALKQDVDEFGKRGPLIVVAGSYHLDIGGRSVNIARILMPNFGVGTFNQVKNLQLTTFLGSPEESLTEGLDLVEPTFTVFASESWRLAVMVCRDLLESSFVEALIRVGVMCSLLQRCQTTQRRTQA